MMDEKALDLKAEVYALTTLAQHLEAYDGFYLDCHGTKERGRNKDVLGMQPRHSVLGHKVIELLGIQVSRNGIFHLLPESLFQPLSIGTTASNTYEIVEEMRFNRAKEAGNRLFFTPFDTEFFRFSMACMERQLGWPGRQEDATRQLLAGLLGQDFGFDEPESMQLLAFFANGEEAKDNAPLLARFLTVLLGREVTISCKATVPPVQQLPSLGGSRLGVDVVLAGFTAAEMDDWWVEITCTEAAELDMEASGNRTLAFVRNFLDYFALATREVRVVLKAVPEACSSELGIGILGLHLTLSPTAA
ncbi:MAG: hypothetical protein RLZZ165_174 [Bacteroidota bacterium]|jgi:hypothetical protein